MFKMLVFGVLVHTLPARSIFNGSETLLPETCVAQTEGALGTAKECRIVDLSNICGYCNGTQCDIPEGCVDDYGCKNGLCGVAGNMTGHGITTCVRTNSNRRYCGNERLSQSGKEPFLTRWVCVDLEHSSTTHWGTWAREGISLSFELGKTAELLSSLPKQRHTELPAVGRATYTAVSQAAPKSLASTELHAPKTSASPLTESLAASNTERTGIPLSSEVRDSAARYRRIKILSGVVGGIAAFALTGFIALCLRKKRQRSETTAVAGSIMDSDGIRASHYRNLASAIPRLEGVSNDIVCRMHHRQLGPVFPRLQERPQTLFGMEMVAMGDEDHTLPSEVVGAANGMLTDNSRAENHA